MPIRLHAEVVFKNSCKININPIIYRFKQADVFHLVYPLLAFYSVLSFLSSQTSDEVKVAA